MPKLFGRQHQVEVSIAESSFVADFNLNIQILKCSMSSSMEKGIIDSAYVSLILIFSLRSFRFKGIDWDGFDNHKDANHMGKSKQLVSVMLMNGSLRD